MNRRSICICLAILSGVTVGAALATHRASKAKSEKKKKSDREARETAEVKARESAPPPPTERRDVLGLYDASFKARIVEAAAIPREVRSGAKPFIGFSLGERVGDVLVSSLYEGTPAHQCGIGLSHQLVSIDSSPVSTLDNVRVALQGCVVGEMSDFGLRDTDGVEYHVDLWIMTKDPAFKGATYFFDTNGASKIEAMTKRLSSKLERVGSKGSKASSGSSRRGPRPPRDAPQQ